MKTRRHAKSVLKTGASFAALSVALALSANASAGALPGHGHFVAGQGTIGKGNQSLTVKQSTTTGIINWNSFSIGAHDAVNFKNGTGATLNRVTGGNLSTIAGSLHATGSLYLMNGQGVIVSGTGRVVTGGSFVATSGNITNTAFDDGKRQFLGAKAAVVNRGSISAGGNARLIGGTVMQSGTIRASNVNLIAREGLAVSGSVAAQNADGTGGKVIATGRTVNVTSTARISASGTTAGIVLIGGDIHGGAIASQDFYGRKIRDARTTTVAAGAQISANATRGKGGDIVIWSDGHTTFGGNLSATGNTAGGFAEVSSHKVLGFTGRVDLLAQHGSTGELLLDPENVVISTAATLNGAITAGTFTPSGDDSILNVGDLEAALSGADVTVTSGATGSQTGDITVLAPVTWSANRLTLDAFHSINIDTLMSATGTAALTLTTNDTGTGGDIFFNDGGRTTFASTGESLTINGHAYTLENSVASLATAIAVGAAGFYALADNYDASGDNSGAAYTTSPIPTTFTGTFEGLGNTISNLTINDSTAGDNVGLFAQIGAGKVRDLQLANVSIIAVAGSAKGEGGLAGVLSGGTVSGVIVSGSVSANGAENVGGLIGLVQSGATINNSFADVTVMGLGGGTNFNTEINAGGFIGALTGGTVSGSGATGMVTGTGQDDNFGGFVGLTNATITTSYATGNVSGSGNGGTVGGFVGSDESSASISSSYANGAVKTSGGSNFSIGGFAGFEDGTVQTSHATGDVTASGATNIGGFVGIIDGASANHDYATGNVSVGGSSFNAAGGFVGIVQGGSASHDYATGNVVGNSSGDTGGFAGTLNTSHTIDESYEAGAVSGGGTQGAFVGLNIGTLGGSAAVFYNTSVNPGLSGVGSTQSPGVATAFGLTSAQMMTASSFTGATHGWSDFGTAGGGTGWVIVDADGSLNNASATGGTTPILLDEYSTTVTNAHQLQLMALDLAANYTLANNIDATGTTGGDVWGSGGFISVGAQNDTFIAAFTGSLDGASRAIDGLTIDSALSDASVGLFGLLNGSASNLSLTNASIGGGTNGKIGGIAGEVDGSVSNVSVSGAMSGGVGSSVGGIAGFNNGTISLATAVGTVTGGDNVFAGGVAGKNSATIEQSSSSANVTVGGHASAPIAAGGLVGYNDASGTISKSFAIGAVTGGLDTEDGGLAGLNAGSISDSYAGGNVIGGIGSNAGGFVGFSSPGTAVISVAYSTGNVTAGSNSEVGGFVGLNGGSIDEAYETGAASAGSGSVVGGFAGNNNSSLGATTAVYFNSSVNSGNGVGANNAIAQGGGLSHADMLTSTNFSGWSFGTTAGGTGWVIIDQDDSYNNDTGQGGGTTPMLLSEWSSNVSNAHQLQLMELDPTANYTLVNDIGAGGTSGSNDVWGSGGFIPVGSNSASGAFSGTFDGAGHTISDLFIDYTDLTGVNRIGLFGLVGAAGVVKNVVLTDADVEAGVASVQLGALVGDNEGTVSNAIIKGNVTGGDSSLIGGAIGQSGGTVSQTSFTGTVTQTGGSSAVGGLIGLVEDGEVTGSYASATVMGGNNGEAGGFVGQINAGAIHGSYATGNVFTNNNDQTGGFAGQVEALIDTSYSTGNATNITSGFVGGFAGVISNSGDIEESYEKGEVFGNAGNSSIGAFVAQNRNLAGTTKADFYNSTDNTAPGIRSDIGSGSNVVSRSSTDMLNSASFTGWSGDFGVLGSGAVWVIVDADESLNNAGSATGGTTPILLNEYSTTITNAHQLQLMQLDPTAAYTVAFDIDASGTEQALGDVWGSHGFVPVGNDPNSAGFTGSFEGNDHTIDHLTIHTAGVSGVGLFSFVDDGATVSDVTLADVSIVASGGSLDAGAVAGFNNGALSNVTVSGSVSGSGAASDVGGVVGFMNGSLTNAHSSATVSATADDSGAGAGGLVGFNNFGTITDSSATGNVSVEGNDVGAGGLVGVNGGTISQSFATGMVTVTDSVPGDTNANVGGGLVGTNTGGTISNSYAMGNVSVDGDGSVAGGFAGQNVNTSTISDSYSLGAVSADLKGGFVGNEGSSTIVHSYWDTQTSGLSSSHGEGITDDASAGLTGKTTSALEAALPSGFSGSTWGIVAGTSLPYLNWQFPTGTPQVVSGLTLSGFNGSGVSNIVVDLVDNGNTLNSSDGTPASYANGFYYFLLAPGSISSGDKVLAYRADAGGSVLAENVTGSLSGLNILNGYFSATGNDANMSDVDEDISTAVGGNTGAQNAVGTPTGTFIDSTGTNFDFDTADNFGTTLIVEQASGAVTQSGAITGTSNLLLLGDANFTFGQANGFHTLAMDGTGSLAFTNNRSLAIGTVAGVNGVDAGGGVTITTTSGNISITQLLEAENHPLTLHSAGTISESGAGFIETSDLSGTSHGSVTLNGDNMVADLGSFDTGGDNAFSLKNVIDLQVDGFVNAGASDLTLTTTGSGHDIFMSGTLLAETVILNSAANISEHLGVIDASNLTGTAHGSVTLDSASNDVLDLQGFATAGGKFVFVDRDELTVSGTLNAGAGDVSLTTTGSGHDIIISDTITGGLVTLTSVGSLTEGGAGKIDATTLKGSSHGTVALNGNNSLLNLGSFKTNNHAFSLLDAFDLEVNGAIDAGAQNVTLKTTGAAHGIGIGALITGDVVTLIAQNGSIGEGNSGSIDATTLKGSTDSNSAVQLQGANKIANLGSFTAGGFWLTDQSSLDIVGALNTHSGNVMIVTAGKGHNLEIDNTISAQDQIWLAVAGTITEGNSGVLDAGSLLGASHGATTLNGANEIANLKFKTSNGDFSFTDDDDLTLGGMNAGAGSLTITTKGSGHDINVGRKLTAGKLTLASAGAITEDATKGEIIATTLTGSSATTTSLTSKHNTFDNLGAFKSGGALKITDDANLTTTGSVNAGSHALSLTIVGAKHDLQIASALTGSTINLNATGAASETNAGAIKADLLNVTAGTGITLTSSKNEITTVGTDKTKTGPNKITK